MPTKWYEWVCPTCEQRIWLAFEAPEPPTCADLHKAVKMTLAEVGYKVIEG